jgi:hypothetical protein
VHQLEEKIVPGISSYFCLIILFLIIIFFLKNNVTFHTNLSHSFHTSYCDVFSVIFQFNRLKKNTKVLVSFTLADVKFVIRVILPIFQNKIINKQLKTHKITFIFMSHHNTTVILMPNYGLHLMV